MFRAYERHCVGNLRLAFNVADCGRYNCQKPCSFN